MKLRSCFGPSTLVTAAFIGPGTLTTCSLAGIGQGYELLWALAFSAIATIVLQEMAARLGWVSRQGLGEAIREQFTGSVSRPLAFTLVIAAILIGNAAYEAGNLSGTVVGLELLFQEQSYWIGLVGGVCFLLLFFGRYQWLEKLFIGLVILMSLCFLVTAIIVQPDIGQILQGFQPQAITNHNFLLVMGLIGTTVVPYNLFLHASVISTKWKREASIWELRAETTVAVLLGTFISILIVVTSATTRGQLEDAAAVENAENFAVQLQPLVGSFANILLGVGFLAAGLSSALTAPLAAAYATEGLFGGSKNDNPKRFRAIWMLILGIGVAVGLTGLRLVYIIKFAQIANAIILPLIGIFLLSLANNRQLMGEHKNGVFSNILGGLVLVTMLALSYATFTKVYNYFV